MPIEPREALPRKEIVKRIQNYVHPFRVTSGKGFDLKEFDPGEPSAELKNGEKARRRIFCNAAQEWLAMEQGRYALRAGSLVTLCSSFRRWTRPERTARSNT